MALALVVALAAAALVCVGGLPSEGDLLPRAALVDQALRGRAVPPQAAGACPWSAQFDHIVLLQTTLDGGRGAAALLPEASGRPEEAAGAPPEPAAALPSSEGLSLIELQGLHVSGWLQRVGRPSATAALSRTDAHGQGLHQSGGKKRASEARRPKYELVERPGAGTNLVLTSVLGGVFALFAVSSCGDFHRLSVVLSGRAVGEGAKEDGKAGMEQHANGGDSEAQGKPRSIIAILGLTIYRFYTGFLSATWLPYLLAMEGAELWRDNQALFMGVAKLIYGMSILLTPLFGLLGDHVSMKSHALGRRLFIRLGILVAAVGIFMCHWAAPRGHFWVFGFGVLVWRIGEGLNDVTIEAICPEMLPPEQFEISSSIRASMFLVGGLMGYVMIAALRDIHYSWLYHGYLIMMFACAVPALLLIRRDSPRVTTRSANLAEQPFWLSCVDAYVRPSQFLGGFPLACLCIFVFSCGSAPMFFLLLMLRDLVGIQERISLQMHFSMISIDFFLSAAVAACLNALLAPAQAKKTPGRKSTFTEIRANSFKITACSVIAFGIACILMPFVYVFPSRAWRIDAFYIISGFAGAMFGSVYARFQDCSWQLLPPDVETANAMGFSTMWKLLGAGLGNFAAGLVLDLFQSPAQVTTTAEENTALIAYRKAGYITVCVSSGVLAFIAGGLVLRLPSRANRGREALAALSPPPPG